MSPLPRLTAYGNPIGEEELRAILAILVADLGPTSVNADRVASEILDHRHDLELRYVDDLGNPRIHLRTLERRTVAEEIVDVLDEYAQEDALDLARLIAERIGTDPDVLTPRRDHR